MTSLQNIDHTWPNGKPTGLELQIQFASMAGNSGGNGREHCRRENSQTRLKPNDCSISSGSASDTAATLLAEPRKTALCFFVMVVVLACNLFFTGMIHDRTPTVWIREKEPETPQPPLAQEKPKILQHPLRDISLDVSHHLRVNTQLQYTLLTISEILVVCTTGFVVIALAFHQHRSIVFRRLMFLVTLLFVVRLISMNVTMLPMSSGELFSRSRCDAKSADFDGGVLARRFVDLLSSCGLMNVKYCGNYVYSGHTVVFVLNCLMLAEYCPSWMMNLPLKALSVCGVALILLSEYDYTISIIIAYYITTRLFWVYHTLANNNSLKTVRAAYDVNQICKEWWYPIFRFLEGNVRAVVPAVRYPFLR